MTARQETIEKAAEMLGRQILLTSKDTPYIPDTRQARKALRQLLRALELPRAADALEAQARELAEARAENKRLRAALARSDQPCAYCTLPAAEWVKCASGFPGCDRADDAMGCPELGATMRATTAERERDEAMAAQAVFAALASAPAPASGVDAVQELKVALANMTDAFLNRHGCFPLDKTNDKERHWCAAMSEAYRLVGQPDTPARAAALSPAATPVSEAGGEMSCSEMLAEAERLAREIGYIVVPDPVSASGEIQAPDFVMDVRPSLRALGFDVVPLSSPADVVRETLEELLLDVTIAQSNMRTAAKYDQRWERCAEAIQPRVDAARAALAISKPHIMTKEQHNG